MIAVICPGQGAQTPGFLNAWLEIETFRESIERMQQASGIDLIKHGTVSDADTIRDTAIAQPLIVSAGIATAATLFTGSNAFSAGVSGVAGHSVGEVTAAAIAGVFDPETAIKFVNTRGKAMAEAAALEPTSMAAVLGGDQAAVEEHLKKLDLAPANFNGGGQIVAAGSASAIAELQANPPVGARVIALQVAGAFHTRYMQPAVAKLQEFAADLTVNDPKTSLWSNAGGVAVTDGHKFVDLIVKQVSSSVRWDLCMQSMLDAGVTALIEVAPAGTLVGLAKRSMPGIESVAVKSPENIDAALSIINNHR